MNPDQQRAVLALLSDEAVWHLNAGRVTNADNIFQKVEALDLVLPPSRLTCMNIARFVEHRDRMARRGVDDL